MTDTQRRGALGGLMDEYERAAAELINLLRTVDGARFLAEYPQEAEHLRSIQKIIRHAVRAAYGYANNIRVAFNLPVTALPTDLEDRAAAVASLENVLKLHCCRT